MFITDISSLSEIDMDFTIDFYFRQQWNDPRLSYTGKEKELCLTPDMLKEIWVPDTFFENAKKASFHETTVRNTFLRILPNGDVFNSIRLTVTAMCHMDLRFFPMDSQVCTLQIESFGYKESDIKYRWRGTNGKEVVGISTDLQLPQFVLAAHREVEKTISLTTGNYSRLAVEMHFVRSMGYYMTHIYIPSVLIVVLSWLSFWLHRDAVPARVALGITTVLTMTTLISSTNASLPKISYLKSVDVYLVTCFVMVFASLVEYSAINYVNKLCKIKKNKMLQKKRQFQQMALQSILPGLVKQTNYPDQQGSSSMPQIPLYSNSIPENVSSHRKRNGSSHLSRPNNNSNVSVQEPHMMSVNRQKTEREVIVNSFDDEEPLSCLCCSLNSEKIDRYSRFIFPTIFIIFNAGYWSIYLYISEKADIWKAKA